MIELRWKKTIDIPSGVTNMSWHVPPVLQYRDRVYHHNPLGAGHVSGEKWQDVPVVVEE